RERGYAMTLGTFVPQYLGICAPIVNWDEEICAAVTVVGRLTRDPEQRQAAALRLSAFCKALSAATC
ncbi:MAG TPA: hypothetical protein VL101_13005, partial [Nordella sp.]|nr:hypothetical protein [Nordella sp.]